MRIISDFHDYYDCIQRMGQDQTLVYLRKQKEIIGWPFPGTHGASYGTNWKNPLTQHYVIGFCGNIIPMVELYTHEGANPEQCWSIEDVDQFMQNNLDREQWRAYKSARWVNGFNYGRRRVFFDKFFLDCDHQRDRYEYLFRKHHAPIFVAGKKKRIVFNANLRDMGFITRFDPYRAFQEIAMYMGILGTHGGHKAKYKGEPMSSEISDRDLAAAKGFDKHSFRSSG